MKKAIFEAPMNRPMKDTRSLFPLNVKPKEDWG